jgi:hypothetical protein
MSNTFELYDTQEVTTDSEGKLTIMVKTDKSTDAIYPSIRDYYATAEYLSEPGEVVATSNEVSVIFDNETFVMRDMDYSIEDPPQFNDVTLPIPYNEHNSMYPSHASEYTSVYIVAYNERTKLWANDRKNDIRWEAIVTMEPEMDYTQWSHPDYAVDPWLGIEIVENGKNLVEIKCHRFTYTFFNTSGSTQIPEDINNWRGELTVNLYVNDILEDTFTVGIYNEQVP